MAEPLKCLILEDSEADLLLLLSRLEREGFQVHHRVGSSAQELTRALAEEDWDIVLSDYAMGEFSALDVIRIVRETRPELPVLVLSGTVGEETAVAAMRAGARDYLLKDSMTRLGEAVRREVRDHERRQAAARVENEAFRQAQILNHIHGSITVTDLNGVITDCNEAAEAFFGLPRDDLIGTHMADFFASDDGPRQMNEAWAYLAREPHFEGRMEFRHASGRVFPAVLSVSLLKDDAGNPAGSVGFALDISDLEEMEFALGRSEGRFRLLFENSLLAILVTDNDGNYLDVNPAAEELFGIPRETFLTMNVADLVVPSGSDAGSQFRAYRSSGLGMGYFTFVRPDGSQRITEYTAVALSPGHHASMLRDITERWEAQKALEKSEAYFQALLDNSPVGILHTDPDGRVLFANAEVLRITGHTREEAEKGGIRVEDMIPDDYTEVREEMAAEVLLRGASNPREMELLRGDGSRVPVVVAKSRGDASDEGRIWFVGDRTAEETLRKEKEALTEQLRAAAKMESVGKLAGGIAHDFNNLLTAILTNASFIIEELGPDHPSAGDAQAIRSAGQRAELLTRQLLAFSRQQVLEPRLLSLTEVVADFSRILPRILGEDVEFTTTLEPDDWKVMADPTQMEQVLLNLAVNARDAMPTGGKLTIETANVVLDEEYGREHLNMEPGPYVMLCVSDTGVGMDAETRERIFEPFFTTKELGQGTGLGLSTVYGIVKQSDGYIWAYSEVGQGTTFKVYLPRTLAEGEDPYPGREADDEADAGATGGMETILVVEDDDTVRRVVCRILAQAGYEVLQASSGQDALELAAAHPYPIQLLLSDVVMPGVSGKTAAEQILEHHPQLSVLFMSGYTDDTITRHGALEEGVHFIQKPFTRNDLLLKVRQVMGR